MRKAKRARKNSVAVIVLALLLVILVTAGTIAWLTKTSSVSNMFTVGSFTIPETDPTDSTEQIDIDEHIYEPSWDASEEHKLVPSATFAKDPYVGIGPDSEDAVVYVKVENKLSNKVYFTLNNGWTPVAGYTTAGSANDTYTSGIFKYNAVLTGSENADAWTTTPLFSSIVTANDATDTDFTPAQGQDAEIVVTAFLHQAKDASGDPISSATIEAAAIAAFSSSSTN